ncbi:MAG: tRNA (adenosine(37)-N6)-threonylcarbamoyltransferase complex ATPase subunit type 1 TsaE [Erysipelotrichaceae bacterium]|nr:tRNA (adenosine(37)-N6)-threonylcarbamoyltransferase complex ATPase subunit type 1 TsaE [Erysipelotrichaceae bacterium]
MKEWKVVTDSPQKTKALAEMIGRAVSAGTLITLSGDLGAGKTTFTQGLAKGLDIDRKVTSPTFTIMKEYKGRLPLYHIDAYRLENITQDLGFEDYIDGDGVCVIEWANFIEYVLPDQLLNIEFTINDDDSRTLTLQGHGDKYEEVISKICTQWE